MSLTAESSLPLQKETTDRKAKRMPLSAYFKGKGKQVAAKMKDKYGDQQGKKVFYGTAAKQGMAPDDDKPKRKSLGQRIGERTDG